MIEPERYATPLAIDQLRAKGIFLSLAAWRDLFLAITDALTGVETSRQFQVRLLGPTRDAERWRVRCVDGMFDAIYDPERAMIIQVTTPRGYEAQLVDRPRDPAPLVEAA